jgi:hypothetical protein
LARHRHKQGSVAIICGGAPSVFDDVEAARALRPSAVLLGATAAAAMFPEINHVWTHHGDEGASLKAMVDRQIKVHCRGRNKRTVPPIIGCDFVWPRLNWVSGSSGFGAALWAIHGLRFHEAILCGVPISTDVLGYHPDRRFVQAGSGFSHNRSATRGWQAQILAFKKRGLCHGIYSMGGWTRDTFGAPPLPGLSDEGLARGSGRVCPVPDHYPAA